MTEQNEVNRLQDKINATTQSALNTGSQATKWLLLSVAILAIAFFAHVFLEPHGVPPAPEATEVAEERG